TVRRLEVATELVLEDAVGALDLLLLAQLDAVAHYLRLARSPVLAGRHVALLNRALLRVAPLALQEELHALAPAQPADRTNVSSHLSSLQRQRTRRTHLKPQHFRSHAAPLRRAAAVVRNRRDVADRLHVHADRLQRPDRGLAAGARPL